MANRKSKHRLILCFMAVLGGILIARLFMISVIGSDKWTSYAEDMSMRAVYETGPRGDVVDRNGRLIATSKPVYSVNISRVDMTREKTIKSAAAVTAKLREWGENLSVSQEEINKSLAEKGYMSYMPIVVAEGISASSAKKIQAENLPGVYISENYVREYPYGAAASHVIGYLGRITETEKGEYVGEKEYRIDAMIGKSGIEKVYEERLKGTDAVSRFQVDSHGDVIDMIDRKNISKGNTVKLTLDMELQLVAEDALQMAVTQAANGGTFDSIYGDLMMSYAPNTGSGAAVAIDIKKGEVLAMASYPDFDPNDFVKGISSDKWKTLQQQNPNDPISPSPMYNIATMSAVQPGSTFKPITALAALDCGLDDKMTLYDGGHVDIGGRSFGCHLWNDTGATHGYVDLDSAMKMSCNYYFYDIATGIDLTSKKSIGYEKEINNEDILTFAKKLGLGQKTGIELEEIAGTVPSEALKKQSVKAALKGYLMSECETYFKKEAIKNSETFSKNIEKIVNQADKSLTLNQLIGKLKQEDFVRKDKVIKLAEICKFSYFDQMNWSMGDTFNIAIGQGDNAYTPLQMAAYMAALGNNGTVCNISLVDDGYRELSDESTIDHDDIRTVIDAMRCVSSEQGGSLYGVFGTFPYKVAAKTGTAQRAGKVNTLDENDYITRHLHLIAPDVSLQEAQAEAARLMKEYPEIYTSKIGALRRGIMNLSSRDITDEDIDRYKASYDNFAWTVAMAPADDPEIAVAVLLVQGKAAINAAPVVREIIGKYGEISQWEKLF